MIPLLTSCVLKYGSKGKRERRGEGGGKGGIQGEREKQRGREGEREGEKRYNICSTRGLLTSLAPNNITLSFSESPIIVSLDAIPLNFIVLPTATKEGQSFVSGYIILSLVLW